MLLFLIGLEVRPQRLWVMRRAVFGLGTAQVVVTAAALAAAAHGFGAAWPAAIVLGAGLALSSTAIVLPMLAERNLLGQRSGRDTFSVLLFQDLAFIPIVAAVPLLAGGSHPDRLPWLEVGEAAAAIAVILVGGRFLIRPAFRAIGGARTPEVFTALALFVVAGTASLAARGRAVHVARRVPRRRAAVGFGVPPRGAGRCRAVRGAAARLLLPLGRHVGQPAAGAAASPGSSPPRCRG